MNELACLGWLTQHDELDLQSASSTDHQLWRVWRVASAERETKNFLRALEGDSFTLNTNTNINSRWLVRWRERTREKTCCWRWQWNGKKAKRNFLLLCIFLNCLFVGLVGSFQSIVRLLVQFFAAFQAIETNFSVSLKVFFPPSRVKRELHHIF